MHNKDMVRAVLKQLAKQWETDKRPFLSTEDYISPTSRKIHWDPTCYTDHSHSGCNSKITLHVGLEDKRYFIGCTITTITDTKNCITEHVEIKWSPRLLKLLPTFYRFHKLFAAIESQDEVVRENDQRSRFITRLNKLFPSSVDKLLLGGKYDD